MKIFPFSAKISYAHLLNGITPKKKQKQKTALYMLLGRRPTNNANKIYDVLTMQKYWRGFAKKLWLLGWNPPKDLEKSTHLF